MDEAGVGVVSLAAGEDESPIPVEEWRIFWTDAWSDVSNRETNMNMNENEPGAQCGRVARVGPGDRHGGGVPRQEKGKVRAVNERKERTNE